MSIERQNRLYSQQRLTTSTLRAIESGVSADFDTLLRSLITSTTPYVVAGLKINIDSSTFSSDADNLTLNSLDATVLQSTSDESGTILNITGSAAELLNSTNSKVYGAFTQGVTNYVSLDLIRKADTDSVDTVYFYDSDADAEISKLLPVATILDYKIVINTTGFSTNLPIATVVTNSSNIPTAITDCRNLLFRLGTGGVSPNPNYNFPWTDGRTEAASTSTSSATDPFSGGDKQIGTFKDWISAVETSIKEVKGSAYWFSASGGGSSTGLNLYSLAEDTTFSYVSGAGAYSHSLSVTGQLSWSSDLFIHSVLSNQYYKVQSNTSGNTIADGYVMALSLTRYISVSGNVSIAPSLSTVPASVTTAAGNDATKIIQGTPGQFTDMVANSSTTNNGDFFKVIADSPKYYDQISEFYGASGSITASANATYAVLVSSYGGATGTQAIQYDKTYYTTANLIVTSSANVLDAASLGSLRWIAARRDYSGVPLIYLRDFGELQMGETRAISDNTTDNILRYIGSLTSTSPNESLSSPTYSATISGGVITSQTNYGGSAGDNLTDRLSKVTTGAANQAQNKNVVLISGGTVAAAGGTLSWDSTATIIINGPGTGTYNTIATGSAAIPTAGAAYVTIDRNSIAALTVSVTTHALVPLGENVYVIGRRNTSGSDIWVGIDGQAYLIADGTNSSTGFSPASSASSGIGNKHNWRQEIPSGSINSSNTSFTISAAPYSTNSLLIFRNGLYQIPTTEYTLSGTNVVFVTAPTTGAEVMAVYAVGKTIPYNYYQESTTVSVTGTTTYTLANPPGNARGVNIFINGLQRRYTDDFTISGSTITFGTAPSYNSIVSVFYTGSNDTFFGDQNTLGGTPNGVKTLFTYGQDISHINAVIVSVDGVFQSPAANTAGSTSWTINDYQFIDNNGLLFGSTGWAGAPPPTSSILYLAGR